MSCLALSLQPANGSDILLQTREWFPPPRALAALSAFRHTRLSLAAAKQNPSASSAVDSIGDDPLSASSGQLIVGVESRYRVVYRLVNSIYVLAITTADTDSSAVNVFDCIHVVNQAVSVLVAACRGVDVTPEKLARKYAEVYMALDIVLRGVSNIRLAAMLGSIHGESIAKMVHSAVDTESKVRGAEIWSSHELTSVERLSGVEVFSNARFEMPPETIAAGDEFAGAAAAAAEEKKLPTEEDEDLNAEASEDPFAASDKLNQPAELVGGFKKTRDPSATDLTKALANLEVTTLPPAEATRPTHIAVEGFEGEYGGIEFGTDKASLGETFEGFSDAWGGGLDASEFVGPEKVPKREGLGGLELLQTGGTDPKPKTDNAQSGDNNTINPLDSLVKSSEMKGPEMYISEIVNAEFRDSLLARVGLLGTVNLKTLPPKKDEKETEFSFRVVETGPVKRFVMQSSRVSSLGDGVFHVRTPPSDDPLTILKYSLLPRLTPLPLRVRLVKRRSGTLLSVMVQYAANPELLGAPLSDVTFILKLPADPTLLQVSPRAVLNRAERELRWNVAEIPAKGPPGKLRVRMPAGDGEEEAEEVVAYVKFEVRGSRSLSGISLRPVSEGKTDFYEVSHRYESGVYMCN